MQITKMVASHCDETHTAFRTEPALTKEVLDCAISNFFPSGWSDMFSTRNDLLIVARAGIPENLVQDYARYLSDAERKIGRRGVSDEEKRVDSLRQRATQAGVPLE